MIETGMTNEGAEQVAEMLKVNKTLKSIHLARE